MGRHRLIAVLVMLGAALASAAKTVRLDSTQPVTAPVATTHAIKSPLTTATGPAAVVILKDEIDDVTRDSVIKRFKQATSSGAKTVILVLNTPGGLVLPAMDITHFLRSQKDVHTIAFVDEMAYSAGIMIGLACDELVMTPQSHIGDCAPIIRTSDGGLQSLGETERAKMESPILAEFYESSLRNGYDPLLTSSMVTIKRTVHYIEGPEGQRKFVEDKEYESLTAKGWKPVEGVPDPLNRTAPLLTVDNVLAAKIGLSKGTFNSPQDLANAWNFDITHTFAPSAGEHIISWLGSAWVRGILIVVLLQAIYLSFGHPGHGWPEAIAAISLILLIGVPLLTGFATWWEAVAILVGLALLAVEIFVLPGHFLPGIVGILLLLGGLVLTFVGTEPSVPGFMPSFQGTWINLQRGLLTVTAGLGVSLALWIWLQRYLPKIPYFNKLILQTSTGDVQMITEPPLESGPAVGDIGIAVSELKPGGSVKFITDSYPDGRIAAVISESGYIVPGTTVIVREVAGNRVVVRKQT